jgi:hypothetical protein
LVNFNSFDGKLADLQAIERLLKVITTVTLRIFEPDLKSIWENYVGHKDLKVLIAQLDEFFILITISITILKKIFQKALSKFLKKRIYN